MKRLCFVVVSVLLVGFSSLEVFAKDDLETYKMDETVITATKQENKPENVPQPVTVISSKEIRDRQAYNAGEMLDFVPGVRIIRSGTVGASNGVSIRSLNGGPSSTKSLVLIDGRPVNDAWARGVNWHSMPAEIIDRIEVVRGPGSALYGSHSSGGVINVFTKKAEPGFHGWFTMGHEFNMSEDIDDKSVDGYGRAEIGASRLGINGSYGAEKTSHFVSFGYRDAKQSFPTPDENKWDNYDLFYKVNHDFSEDIFSRFTLDIHNNTWDNKADRRPGESSNDNYAGDFFTKWQTGNGVLSGRFYVNRSNSEDTVYQSDLKTGETSTTTGIITDYSMPLANNSMVIFGLDAHFNKADIDYEKTVVKMTSRGVETVNVKDKKTGIIKQLQADTFDGEYGTNSQSYDENNIAVFAQYSQTLLEKLNVVAGGRFDVHSVFGSVFNPKAGLTYELFEKGGYTTTAKLNYGTAFRAPPMWGLFSQSTGGYGDPDLEPEKTKNIDVGLFQRFAELGYAELTFFHMDVTQLLINDKLGSTGEGYYVFVPTGTGVDTTKFNQRKNLGNYSPKGVEFGFKVRPVRQLALMGAYTYLDPGDFSFQTSKHRYNIGFNGFVPLGEHRLEAEILYNSTGDGYFFDYETRPYDAFSITDARISFDYQNKYRLSVNVKNFTDTKYRLWHHTWQPGRTVIVSLESKF